VKSVYVNKERLLETLRENREEHRALFEEAQVKYREKVIEVLDKRLAEARAGGRVRTYINLPEPVDYTKNFDEAIQMVEWEESDSIELDERDFQRYVLNKWEWAGAFAANTTAYVVGAVDEDAY
jgi:hypothetical protein